MCFNCVRAGRGSGSSVQIAKRLLSDAITQVGTFCQKSVPCGQADDPRALVDRIVDTLTGPISSRQEVLVICIPPGGDQDRRRAPAFRNDNFGGAALPMRGLPH